MTWPCSLIVPFGSCTLLGNPQGLFCFWVYEVYVQREMEGMEQCSTTGAVRGAWGAVVSLWVWTWIPVSDSSFTIKGKRYWCTWEEPVPHFCTVMSTLQVVGYWDHHQLDGRYVWSVGLQTGKSKKSVRLSHLQNDEGTVNNFFPKIVDVMIFLCSWVSAWE